MVNKRNVDHAPDATVGRGAHVELTVHSLHGIEWKSYNEWDDAIVPSVTAAVSFSGSASNMEISSSTMCGRTGHLVIESNSMNLDTERPTRRLSGENSNEDDMGSHSTSSCCKQTVKDRKSLCYRMVATFHDSIEGRRSQLASPNSSSSTLRFASRPHLRLELPQVDPKSATVDLSKANRDSRIVLSQNSNTWLEREAEEETSTVSGSTKRTAGLPEIVELHVTLRDSEDISIVQQGIAHLVLFGNQKGQGPYVLDLPIKKKICANPTQPCPTSPPSVQLIPSAYVRVQVNIIPELQPVPVHRTPSEDRERLGNIMDRLRENEASAARRAKEAKWTNLLQRKKDVMPPNARGGIGKNKRVTRPAFLTCGGIDWKQSIQAFVEAVRGCGSKDRANKKKGKQSWPKTTGYGGLTQSNSFMASTIATRESLEI